MALSFNSSRGAPALIWGSLPPLPPSPGQTVQPGVAGPFVGVHHGALIVAGGANFPDRSPWDGGVKAWWDDVFVLQREGGGSPRWVEGKHFKLPRAMGYGASFSTSEGVICAGGCDGDRCYSDVFILSWDPASQELSTHFLPSLPEPLAFMGFARVGDTLYVAGGQQATKGYGSTRSFWSLDLAKKSSPSDFRWKVLPPIPGPARVVPVAAAQEVDGKPAFFLFSGRIQADGKPTTLLTDASAYLPSSGTWRTLHEVGTAGGGPGTCIMAGTAVPWGTDDILILSGDSGKIFMELEGLDLQAAEIRKRLADASGSDQPSLAKDLAAVLKKKKDLSEHHPGFGHRVFDYHVKSDRWEPLAPSPLASQVTTLAVPWEGTWIVANGEVRPGIRTPRVTTVSVSSP